MRNTELGLVRASNPVFLIPNSKVIRLETIFRQEAGSYIITNAHHINQGQMPIVDNKSATDFFLFKVEDPAQAAQLCIELVHTRIPRRFAIPSQDIQVLSPMHRGGIGVGASLPFTVGGSGSCVRIASRIEGPL